MEPHALSHKYALYKTERWHKVYTSLRHDTLVVKYLKWRISIKRYEKLHTAIFPSGLAI
jgi:hypothetical protein